MTETAVIIESFIKGSWETLAQINPSMQPGSLSSYEPEGRQIYLFGWLHDDDRGLVGPAVWRSTFGLDSDIAADRLVESMALEEIADLTKASCLLDRYSDVGRKIKVRFRLAE